MRIRFFSIVRFFLIGMLLPVVSEVLFKLLKPWPLVCSLIFMALGYFISKFYDRIFPSGVFNTKSELHINIILELLFLLMGCLLGIAIIHYFPNLR